ITVMMTTEKNSINARTYFQKENKYGLTGITEVLTQLHQKYTADPDHIEEVTDSVTHALKQTVQSKSDQRLTKEATDEVYQQLRQQFDPAHGGFGTAPQFPQPQNLLFLLRYYYFT